MTPQLYNSLLIGALLFMLGTVGFLTRRNLIMMFLSVELMLQAVALNLIAFGRTYGNFQGQAFTIFVLTVAACEAGIALVLFLAIYGQRKTLDVSIWQELREPDQEPIVDEEPLPTSPPAEPLPTLTPAGKEPAQPKEPSHV